MAINEVSLSPHVGGSLESSPANQPLAMIGDAEKHLAGTLWRDGDGDIYVMATTGVGKQQLIALIDGNRWTEPHLAGGDPFGNDREEFTRIPPGSTVSIVVGEG